MVPGVGCTKYYGVAISIVDDVIIESTDGVGQIVQCNAKEEIAYAWERTYLDNPWDSPEHAHVCGGTRRTAASPSARAAPPSSSLLRKLAQLFAIVSFLAAAALAIGACTARYVRTLTSRRRASAPSFSAVVEKHQQGRARAARHRRHQTHVRRRRRIRRRRRRAARKVEEADVCLAAAVAALAAARARRRVQRLLWLRWRAPGAAAAPPPLRTRYRRTRRWRPRHRSGAAADPGGGVWAAAAPPELARLSSTTAYSPSGRRACRRTVSFSPRSPPPSTPPSYTKAGSAERLSELDSRRHGGVRTGMRDTSRLPTRRRRLPAAPGAAPAAPSGIELRPHHPLGHNRGAADLRRRTRQRRPTIRPPPSSRRTEGAMARANTAAAPRSLACTRPKS